MLHYQCSLDMQHGIAHTSHIMRDNTTRTEWHHRALGSTHIIITPLDDIPAGNDNFLTSDDIAVISELGCDKRKREQATWRNALRKLLATFGNDWEHSPIAYLPVGAPYLTECPLHIGVSHTSAHAAIIVSERPCAIDIEQLSRCFSRIASRYLSSDEYKKYGDTLLPETWCAKETLYKVSGRNGLKLTSDLQIIASDNGTLTGAIHQPDGTWNKYLLHTFRHADTVCVWTDSMISKGI